VACHLLPSAANCGGSLGYLPKLGECRGRSVGIGFVPEMDLPSCVAEQVNVPVVANP
jgi:hypothetical protein